MALERWEVKVLCMAGLFLNQLIFILLPLKVSAYVNSKGKKGVLALSTLSCFGGGVFFGAYLMHLSPEVRSLLDGVLMVPYNINYPIPEAIAGFGFFLILYIEMGVMALQRRNAKKSQLDKRPQPPHFKPINDDAINSEVKLVGCIFTDVESLKPTPGCPLMQDERSVLTSTALIKESVRQGKAVQPCMGGKCIAPAGGCCQGPVGSVMDCCSQVEDKDKHNSSTLKELDAVSTCSSGMRSSSSSADFDQQAAMARSAIFTLALALDSIFEGLSMGLKLNSNDVVTLFVAIISHEFVMSFCIGLELVKHYPRKTMVAVGIAYALTPVIGAAIGTAIVETADYDGNTTVDIVNGVLQSICAGAFIYCAFIGILSEELTHSNGLLKASVTLLGFAFMAGMAAIPDSSGDDTQPEATTTMTHLTSA